ncbi:MAG: 6-pyruvoyltetrahydropterin/6-carboxytetrahydropterin synthase [Bacteroidia bacterium]
MKVSVFRKAHFNAAHRLNNASWSDEKNRETFGKCNYPNYHGHNYVLEVKLSGEVDQETGYVMDLSVLKQIIDKEVLEAFDHKNLNLDVPEFKTLNPTAENIGTVIFEKLRNRIDERYGMVVRLYETERNFVEITE